MPNAIRMPVVPNATYCNSATTLEFILFIQRVLLFSADHATLLASLSIPSSHKGVIIIEDLLLRSVSVVSQSRERELTQSGQVHQIRERDGHVDISLSLGL